MIELVDPNDSRAVRNKNNVLRFYDLVINQKKSEESISTFMTPGYIQHNPLIPDGAEALGKFFGQITKERANARVVVDKIDGRALEHWDTLQPVGDPKNSAPWLAPNLPRANPNGMF